MSSSQQQRLPPFQPISENINCSSRNSTPASVTELRVHKRKKQPISDQEDSSSSNSEAEEESFVDNSFDDSMNE